MKILALFAFLALLSGCAATIANIELSDGTKIKVADDKSREGVTISWTRNADGSFAVNFSSQKSGTDPAVTEIAKGLSENVSKALDKVPVTPVK